MVGGGDGWGLQDGWKDQGGWRLRRENITCGCLFYATRLFRVPPKESIMTTTIKY
jgi:hypothetical protein